uniref:hypothetical protein n=1 Tax=Okeania sp. SIO2F4 TaxID=2607790 RepID=UPI0025E8310B|nr:hypothetical protein [Okeania sp. SIO2F4]
MRIENSEVRLDRLKTLVVLHGNGEDIYFLISPTVPISSSPRLPISETPHLRDSQSPNLPISSSPHLPISSSPHPPISESPHLPIPPSPYTPGASFTITIHHHRGNYLTFKV